jgi:hypothetical protein
MTYSLTESKWTTLRKNAVAYYQAVVFPCDPDQFDQRNPKPRMALDAELTRIAEKERKEGRTW